MGLDRTFQLKGPGSYPILSVFTKWRKPRLTSQVIRDRHLQLIRSRRSQHQQPARARTQSSVSNPDSLTGNLRCVSLRAHLSIRIVKLARTPTFTTIAAHPPLRSLEGIAPCSVLGPTRHVLPSFSRHVGKPGFKLAGSSTPRVFPELCFSAWLPFSVHCVKA